jgi:acyl-coenzyme A synthetase/AMP-(fatty) acid ligase
VSFPNRPNVRDNAIETIAIGAVWSWAVPELGVNTVIERFAQIEPKQLSAADGYTGESTREAEVRRIVANCLRSSFSSGRPNPVLIWTTGAAENNRARPRRCAGRTSEASAFPFRAAARQDHSTTTWRA